jgi:hypothetical protein
MGVSKGDFFSSTPKILKAYDKAHEEKIKTMDALAWQFCGSYVLSAVSVAVDHCLNAKKAVSKYMEKPVMQNKYDYSEEMTEEEIKRQRELFVAKLMIMKSNYELNHKSDKE